MGDFFNLYGLVSTATRLRDPTIEVLFQEKLHSLILLFLHLSLIVLPNILLRNFISVAMILLSCLLVNGHVKVE